MSFKTLLVHVESSSQSNQRLRAAVGLAAGLRANLKHAAASFRAETRGVTQGRLERSTLPVLFSH